MRTTITLDPDVALRVQEEMRASGQSFTQTVNAALRRAFAPAPTAAPPPRRLRGRSLGQFPGLNYDKISELIEETEGPWPR